MLLSNRSSFITLVGLYLQDSCPISIISILNPVLGQASTWKALLGKRLKPKALSIKVINKRLKDTKNQRTRLERRLRKCWWGVILRKPTLHIWNCQDGAN